jgi:hypothetical protein
MERNRRRAVQKEQWVGISALLMNGEGDMPLANL